MPAKDKGDYFCGNQSVTDHHSAVVTIGCSWSSEQNCDWRQTAPGRATIRKNPTRKRSLPNKPNKDRPSPTRLSLRLIVKWPLIWNELESITANSLASRYKKQSRWRWAKIAT